MAIAAVSAPCTVKHGSVHLGLYSRVRAHLVLLDAPHGSIPMTAGFEPCHVLVCQRFLHRRTEPSPHSPIMPCSNHRPRDHQPSPKVARCSQLQSIRQATKLLDVALLKVVSVGARRASELPCLLHRTGCDQRASRVEDSLGIFQHGCRVKFGSGMLCGQRPRQH